VTGYKAIAAERSGASRLSYAGRAMTTHMPDQQPAEKPEYRTADARRARLERRRERIRAEIERNRAGGHRVPTWALAGVLGLVLLAWIVLVVTS